MKKLARLLLLWLIMTVIPVQGIAASAMFHCGAGNHQSMAINEKGHASHPYDHYLASDSSGEVSPNSQVAHSVSDECPSCAACCIGCAIVMATFDLTSSSPASEKIDFLFSSHTGHISDGLERPPRI